MTFLFDSLACELADRGLELRLAVHPIFALERGVGDAVTGIETDLVAAGTRGLARESLIHLHIPALGSPAAEADLKEALLGVLSDVRAANRDFLAMRARVHDVSKTYRRESGPIRRSTVRRRRISSNGWWPTISSSSACAAMRSRRGRA